MVNRESGSTWCKRRKTRNENVEGDVLGQAPAGVPPGTIKKTGVAPGNQGDYQGGASGCGGWGTDRGHAGSMEGIMDLVDVYELVVPESDRHWWCALMVMAVSRIF